MLPEDWRGIELEAVSAHESPDAGVITHG
jgi:hypothetical protein